jgi:hypothetical protein
VSEWQDISTAPKDGTAVIAAKKSGWITAFSDFPYPLTSRFIDGKWCANFGDIDNTSWEPYDPQPSHWKPK